MPRAAGRREQPAGAAGRNGQAAASGVDEKAVLPFFLFFSALMLQAARLPRPAAAATACFSRRGLLQRVVGAGNPDDSQDRWLCGFDLILFFFFVVAVVQYLVRRWQRGQADGGLPVASSPTKYYSDCVLIIFCFFPILVEMKWKRRVSNYPIL